MVFPKFKDKDKQDSLTTPEGFLSYLKRIGKYPKFDPPDGVVFCYSRRLLNYVVENYETKRVEWFAGESYLLEEKGKRLGVIGKFGIGAPAAVVLMEELIAFGVKKFLSIGEAGSLQKDLKLGDIVVCQRAIRDEGTSHHYLKSSKYAYPSASMLERTEEVLDDLGIKYHLGTTWTIDAPYRETVAEVRKYQKEGVLTVEMEAAAIFAVASYRKVEVGAVFTISDHLGELEWDPKFHLTTGHMAKLFKIAKKVLIG